jgi:hypothetical protein
MQTHVDAATSTPVLPFAMLTNFVAGAILTLEPHFAVRTNAARAAEAFPAILTLAPLYAVQTNFSAAPAPAILTRVPVCAVLTNAAAPAILALGPESAVLTEAAAPAILALAFLSAMLTNAAAPALLTPCLLFAVLTKAAAPALLALAPQSAVLTNGAAPALLTPCLPFAMLTKAAAPALPTRALLSAMLTKAAAPAILAQVPPSAMRTRYKPCPSHFQLGRNLKRLVSRQSSLLPQRCCFWSSGGTKAAGPRRFVDSQHVVSALLWQQCVQRGGQTGAWGGANRSMGDDGRRMTAASTYFCPPSIPTDALPSYCF